VTSALAQIDDLLPRLSPEQLAYVDWQMRWTQTARPNQIPPEGDWTECGFMAGRGFGKTRVGAEWLAREAYEDPLALPSYVIAPTQADVRFTCFEGESGLMSILPNELVKDYNRSDLILTLTNGATIRGFSAEKPDRLRGPQACRCWGDELAAWTDGETVWDMMAFGLRLGPHPQVVWTTTPKPTPLVRRLTTPQEGRVIITGSTYDNKANLPKTFFRNLKAYEGTKIGRQELDGELLDPEEAGIVRRSWFNLWPASKPLPKLDFIVMSLDTAFTEASINKKGDPDPTACVVLGVFHIKRVAHVILLDCWDEHLGMPELIRKTKRELNTAYGDDEDNALIKPMYGSAKPLTSGRKADVLLIEDKGSGISLRQSLAESGIEAYAYNPGRADKVSRLHIVSPVFAQRRFWLPESDRTPGKFRTWAEPMVSQLCSFTGEGSTKHDDFVDACTQALRLCIDKGLVKLVKADPKTLIQSPPRERVNPYGQ